MDNLQEDAEPSEEGSDDGSSEDEDDKTERKQVFKAAKLNPLLPEDRETKKKRREEFQNRQKAQHSDYVKELRREIYDEPEEVHLGGMVSQRTKFTREQEQIEKLEQEHFKRMNFTKKEVKTMRHKAKDEMQDRLDKMDDLRGLEEIVGKRSRVPDHDNLEAQIGNDKFSKSLSKYVKSGDDRKGGRGGKYE